MTVYFCFELQQPPIDTRDCALVVGDDGIVDDFHKPVPDMAVGYPFELEKF
jgi:hypothetical protein